MINRYKSASRLGKVFVWLSVGMPIAILAVYTVYVASALALDPNSHQCTNDSMMEQTCRDPFGSSIEWTILAVSLFGWPVLAVWVTIGILLVVRRMRTASAVLH